MSQTGPSEAEAFLAFARAQVASSGAECTPEELLARWRTKRPAGTVDDATSALDALRNSGLLGCIDTGVGDLSTNKSHMEGFATS
jgi:hypothetical protein